MFILLSSFYRLLIKIFEEDSLSIRKNIVLLIVRDDLHITSTDFNHIMTIMNSKFKDKYEKLKTALINDDVLAGLAPTTLDNRDDDDEEEEEVSAPAGVGLAPAVARVENRDDEEDEEEEEEI